MNKWTIKFHGDEVRIYKGECLNPDNCSCSNPPKCYYTAEEAQQMIIEHYQAAADKFRSMNKTGFLRYFGYIEEE